MVTEEMTKVWGKNQEILNQQGWLLEINYEGGKKLWLQDEQMMLTRHHLTNIK